ncbi:MAG: type II secretion system protein [Candidatus Saccharimonadales bacterium]
MNLRTHHRSAGFTIIELFVVIVILIAASLLFFYQKNSLEVARLDERRKTAINALYYNLEEVYYPKHQAYPQELTPAVLPAVDPELLTDTNGITLGEKLDLSNLDDDTKQLLESAGTHLSEYRYEPINCDNAGKCKQYILRVALAKEGEYVKKSRRN